jgi:hypothetical protein
LVTDGQGGAALRIVKDSKLYLQEKSRVRRNARKSRPTTGESDDEGMHATRRTQKVNKRQPASPANESDEDHATTHRAMRKHQKQQPVSEGRGSSDEMSIEARPRAPLPSRARVQNRDRKRRRTDNSEDEDDNIRAIPTKSSHNQSDRSATATSHSSTCPTIARHQDSPNIDSTSVPQPHLTPQLANSAVPMGSAPGPSRVSSQPFISRYAANVPGRPSPSGFPYSHPSQRQQLPPVAEDGRFNMARRNFRPQAAPSQMFAPPPSAQQYRPLPNPHQRNIMPQHARSGPVDPRYAGMFESQPQDFPPSQYSEYTDNGYGTYIDDNDGGMGWGGSPHMEPESYQIY